MAKYLFQWTEIMYNEVVIEADTIDEADMIFSNQEIDGVCVDMQFGDGPLITEVDNNA